MTLKLTPQQAEALFNLYNEYVLLGNPTGIDERLIQVHMVKIYQKFRNQYEGRPRKSYSLNVTEAEALAYWIYWRDVPLTGLVFEFAFITSHVQQIDRELNTKIYTTPNSIKLLK